MQRSVLLAQAVVLQAQLLDLPGQSLDPRRKSPSTGCRQEPSAGSGLNPRAISLSRGGGNRAEDGPLQRLHERG
ncbi:MAG TPA: hypothetical protein VM492_00215, partial [Sumerlaeia bacterium]|nr:hypothetical protein [Sumerlaeia bacterium]